MVDDSWSLLSRGRGREILMSIQICGLPCSFIRAVSLYMIGSLEYSSLVDWVDWVLWSESTLSSEELGVEAPELGVLRVVKLDGLEVM